MLEEQDRAFRLSEPRETAQVWFQDGRVFEGPIGTPLEHVIRAAYPEAEVPIAAALIDGELRELTYRVESDVEVTPLDITNSDGMRVYRRSLSFLLVTAVQELHPGSDVFVDHSATFGGYFCRPRRRPPFSAEELAAVEARMRQIVDADEPILKERVPLSDAVGMFRARGDDDKVRLLSTRRKGYLTLYRLRHARDYFHGYMVPSTGYLPFFGLEPAPPGFFLRFPQHHEPTVLQPYVDSPQMMAVFREYGGSLDRLGVPDVGALNQAIEGERAREVILVSEALHEARISSIADAIARREKVRLVLIAGPSSAGKTTFSQRLSIQLLANGLRPFPLEMDHYFVPRDRTPRDESGEYDFESLYALDLTLFHEHLLRLMAGDEVYLPRYNFHTGQREMGDRVRLRPDHVILVEGIHGLNPELVGNVPTEALYRIYVSALTQLNIDKHNRVPTTDTRLLRRIVRDATRRGYSATDTLKRWRSVRRGEKRWIFPYQEHADVMFNSALAYELAVLKPLAEPLLRQVEAGTREHVETKRLLAFLEWFVPCATDLIPDNSILREFVGGSILSDFRVSL
jgi:uridine kinase